MVQHHKIDTRGLLIQLLNFTDTGIEGGCPDLQSKRLHERSDKASMVGGKARVFSVPLFEPGNVTSNCVPKADPHNLVRQVTPSLLTLQMKSLKVTGVIGLPKTHLSGMVEPGPAPAHVTPGCLLLYR